MGTAGFAFAVIAAGAFGFEGRAAYIPSTYRIAAESAASYFDDERTLFLFGRRTFALYYTPFAATLERPPADQPCRGLDPLFSDPRAIALRYSADCGGVELFRRELEGVQLPDSAERLVYFHRDRGDPELALRPVVEELASRGFRRGSLLFPLEDPEPLTFTKVFLFER